MAANSRPKRRASVPVPVGWNDADSGVSANLTLLTLLTALERGGMVVVKLLITPEPFQRAYMYCREACGTIGA